jgi:hypothetical protein
MNKRKKASYGKMKKMRGGDYMEPNKELKFGGPSDRVKAKKGRRRAVGGEENGPKKPQRRQDPNANLGTGNDFSSPRSQAEPSTAQRISTNVSQFPLRARETANIMSENMRNYGKNSSYGNSPEAKARKAKVQAEKNKSSEPIKGQTLPTVTITANKNSGKNATGTGATTSPLEKQIKDNDSGIGGVKKKTEDKKTDGKGPGQTNSTTPKPGPSRGSTRTPKKNDPYAKAKAANSNLDSLTRERNRLRDAGKKGTPEYNAIQNKINAAYGVSKRYPEGSKEEGKSTESKSSTPPDRRTRTSPTRDAQRAGETTEKKATEKKTEETTTAAKQTSTESKSDSSKVESSQKPTTGKGKRTLNRNIRKFNREGKKEDKKDARRRRQNRRKYLRGVSSAGRDARRRGRKEEAENIKKSVTEASSIARSRRKTGGFGSTSVKAGYDNNHNITRADYVSKGKMADRRSKAKKGRYKAQEGEMKPMKKRDFPSNAERARVTNQLERNTYNTGLTKKNMRDIADAGRTGLVPNKAGQKMQANKKLKKKK